MIVTTFFIAKQKLLSEFIDRSPESPGIIHVYASNLHANKRYISTELLNQLVIEENKEMEKYTKKEEYEESKTSR